MSGTNGTREGFDANQRAHRREAAPVAIGDKTYFPARLTNRALRDVRKLARQAGVEGKRAMRESTEYAEALVEAKEDGLDEEEARKFAEEAGSNSEAVDEINRNSLAAQLPLLLRDQDGNRPTAEEILKALDDDLDARDVGPLMTYLMGDEDPTQTPTETTTTS